MIRVPQLCGNKDVFTREPSGGNSCLQGLAHLTLVPISFRTIEVSKSGFQRVSGSTHRRGCISNKGAKPEYGHLAESVVERHSRIPKIRRFDHDDSSTLSRVQHHRSDSRTFLIFVDHFVIFWPTTAPSLPFCAIGTQF
jgi:hypothetical protein